MERLRFNMNDLIEELRMNNYPNIADIEVAVLETNGQISIIPKAHARAVTVSDMKIKNPPKEGLVYMIISDGELNKNELKRCGKSEQWILDELKKRKIEKLNEVFIASLDMQGELFIQMKGEEDRG